MKITFFTSIGFTSSCLLLALLPLNAHAQEWTQLRGPNGTGISAATTIPTTFAEADYNWRVELPGKGHSSPVIWGSKIFVTSAEEEKGKRHLICVDSATGKLLWTKTYSFKPYSHHEFNTAASASPTVDADLVYAIWPTPDSYTVTAVDHEGHEVWSKDFGSFPT